MTTLIPLIRIESYQKS